MRAPQQGQVLGDRYRLVRPLGSGGFGSVWYAEHLALHSPVALKILDPVVLGDEDSVQRFLREARAAAALRSPHVVQILDYGADSGVRYIVMEVLEGESLEERIEREKLLGIADTERIVRHVGRAISRAHDAGIVHRDLKPGNIFIVPNDGDDIVKVLDFGVAKATNVALGRSLIIGATPAGTLLGTPHYMSPEQAQGMRNLDFRTDFWSVGVIAYECLLGELPFPGDNLAEVISAICSAPLRIPSAHGKVPDGFDAWFARACARAPSDRFESAKQMAAELTGICKASRTSAWAPSISLSETTPAAAAHHEHRDSAPVHVAAPMASVPSPSAAVAVSGRNHRQPSPVKRRMSGRAPYAIPSLLVAIVAIVAWRACGGDSTGDNTASIVQPLAASQPKQPAEAARPPSGPTPIRITPIDPALEIMATADLNGVSAAPVGRVGEMRSVGAAPSTSARSPEPRRAPGQEHSSDQAPRPSPDSSMGGTPSAARNASSDCEPPWYLDERGIQRVKPDCL